MKDRTPHEIARPIVTFLIQELIRKGFTPTSVDDGEALESVAGSIDEALEHIFSVDESTLYLRSAEGKRYCVVLITYNGEDCIHDWTGDGGPFGDAVSSVLDSLEHFRCPRCAAVFPESEALVQVETIREPGLAVIHLGSLACASCESDDIVPCKAAPRDT